MTDSYTLPLVTRYASQEMSFLFSPKNKYLTWRKLWISLAEAEKDAGLPISDDAIDSMKKYAEDIDYDRVAFHEKRTKHEVMAHIHAFAEKAEKAEGILHLGATSSFVMDNGDLILFRDALALLYQKLLHVLSVLADFAEKHAGLPCCGYTHFQVAQPTTIGKRAASWLQDLYFETIELKSTLETLPFLGVRGATGTQSSFLQLVGSKEKVDALEQKVAEDFGFTSCFPIVTQTYPRRVDTKISNHCTGIASALCKFATDLRLLSHTKEVTEPFEKDQVGSSAMPYKRNPMRAERMCSLARFVMNLGVNAAQTASLQWLERSLDDSANRRLTMPQLFLGIDAMLSSAHDLIPKLQVNENEIAARFDEARPLFEQELALMDACREGISRQKAHEDLRKKGSLKEGSYTQSEYIGTAKAHVESFIETHVKPLVKEKQQVCFTSPKV